MSDAGLELRHVVRLSDVGEDGLPVTLEADAAARTALARHLGIPEVVAFAARMTIERWRRDGLMVRGRVDAEVVQTCVVTLQPVRNAVQESFEDYFAPYPLAERGESDGLHPEDVEPLVDQRLDAGALAVEHLVLGLDPYPRCEGAGFEATATAEKSEKDKPFAALDVLRKDRG